jgi:hypothetical protein
MPVKSQKDMRPEESTRKMNVRREVAVWSYRVILWWESGERR